MTGLIVTTRRWPWPLHDLSHSKIKFKSLHIMYVIKIFRYGTMVRCNAPTIWNYLRWVGLKHKHVIAICDLLSKNQLFSQKIYMWLDFGKSVLMSHFTTQIFITEIDKWQLPINSIVVAICSSCLQLPGNNVKYFENFVILLLTPQQLV